jgi:hypothetical protein
VAIERDQGFVIVRPEFSYENIPKSAQQAVPGFSLSPEFQELLENDLEEFPGIVLGALRRFVLRLQVREGELSVEEGQSLTHGYEFIERLASSSDEKLRTALVEEIFEVLNPNAAVTRGFYERLGQTGRRLYHQHCIDPTTRT